MTSTSAQSGGPFVITQSVVASSGVTSASGTTNVESTSGQPAAGDAVQGAQFTVTSGFWNYSPLAPTAATTTVAGRVTTAQGFGIRNAILTMTSAADGSIRIAASGSLGYYQFTDIEVGHGYIIAVSSKRFTFSQPVIFVTVVDQMVDVDFVAEPTG